MKFQNRKRKHIKERIWVQIRFHEIPKSKNITIIGENGKIKADFIKKTIILNYEKNSKKYKFKFNKDKVFETEINYFITEYEVHF